MSGPKISPGGKVTTPVLNIDIAPTLLDLAGVSTGADMEMDGLSISPLVLPENTTQPGVETNEVSRVRRDAVDVSNSTSGQAPPSVPILTNYTGIQGRINFLVEAWGTLWCGHYSPTFGN